MAARRNGSTPQWQHAAVAASSNGRTPQWPHAATAALRNDSTQQWLPTPLQRLQRRFAAHRVNPRKRQSLRPVPQRTSEIRKKYWCVSGLSGSATHVRNTGAPRPRRAEPFRRSRPHHLSLSLSLSLPPSLSLSLSLSTCGAGGLRCSRGFLYPLSLSLSLSLSSLFLPLSHSRPLSPSFSHTHTFSLPRLGLADLRRRRATA